MDDKKLIHALLVYKENIINFCYSDISMGNYIRVESFGCTYNSCICPTKHNSFFFFYNNFPFILMSRISTTAIFV